MAKTVSRRKKVTAPPTKIAEPTPEPDTPEPSDNEIESKSKTPTTFAEMVFLAIIAVLNATGSDTFTYQSIEKHMENTEGEVRTVIKGFIEKKIVENSKKKFRTRLTGSLVLLNKNYYDSAETNDSEASTTNLLEASNSNRTFTLENREISSTSPVPPTPEPEEPKKRSKRAKAKKPESSSSEEIVVPQIKKKKAVPAKRKATKKAKEPEVLQDDKVASFQKAMEEDTPNFMPSPDRKSTAKKKVRTKKVVVSSPIESEEEEPSPKPPTPPRKKAKKVPKIDPAKSKRRRSRELVKTAQRPTRSTRSKKAV